MDDAHLSCGKKKEKAREREREGVRKMRTIRVIGFVVSNRSAQSTSVFHILLMNSFEPSSEGE